MENVKIHAVRINDDSNIDHRLHDNKGHNATTTTQADLKLGDDYMSLTTKEKNSTTQHTIENHETNFLCEQQGQWPEELRELLYLQLPKEGATQAGQRRPIALLPMVYRVWAAWQKHRINEWRAQSRPHFPWVSC
eukprot:990069-Amphidinium_carterae.1